MGQPEPHAPRAEHRVALLERAHALNTHPGQIAELILEAVSAAAQTPTHESSSRSSTAG